MTHKEWLDNEYSQWIKALQESTVHNFKEHPVVKRMLLPEEIETGFYAIGDADESIMMRIDAIGYEKFHGLSRPAIRMIYYANKILKLNPSSICEIGGGVGQFYAILRALGWKGNYYVMDLPEVRNFQGKYWKEVEKQTGIDLTLITDNEIRPFSETFICSFYALGEFNDHIKENYFKDVINPAQHGYIAWNAHSGASDDLSLFKHDIKVTEGIEPNIKIIQW